ncbi:RES domain-containing protein [Sphingomonas sp. MA1305]|uniref:RES family NAD+ phosphorylase n=1 Tax=Sphingomonas sp. MA1305 TaxID=2479204 RepID=UPI0018E057F3|nr:RES family NAD+ phosphorylase [Sphingomonas sp. MA1305]MBI0477156.1 RES domain-containing protein [Sphingomonas sp. MA1305]
MSTRSAPGSDALDRHARAYHGRVIRMVEAQHRIATNRLADDAGDQALLEALADAVKPALPEAARALPWLLAAPFRYGLGRPSRFRAADVLPGILYAAEAIDTAVAETAYWRLVAFARSPGFQRPRTPTPMSAFAVRVTTARALDLTQPPFDAPPDLWTHPTDYAPTQALAAAARRAGIAALRAPSARHAGGITVAVLDPAALIPPPAPHSSWAFLALGDGLIATREMSMQAPRFTAAEFGIS